MYWLAIDMKNSVRPKVATEYNEYLSEDKASNIIYRLYVHWAQCRTSAL